MFKLIIFFLNTWPSWKPARGAWFSSAGCFESVCSWPFLPCWVATWWWSLPWSISTNDYFGWLFFCVVQCMTSGRDCWICAPALPLNSRSFSYVVTVVRETEFLVSINTITNKEKQVDNSGMSMIPFARILHIRWAFELNSRTSYVWFLRSNSVTMASEKNKHKVTY